MASPESFSSPEGLNYGGDRTEAPKWQSSQQHCTTSWYTSSPVDFELPCTATEDQTCQIFYHLPVLNKILYCFHYELRGCSRRNGQLSLVSLGHSRRFRPSAEDIVDWHRANCLLTCLLRNHRCIDTLELFYLNMCDQTFHPHECLSFDAFRKSTSVRFLSISFFGAKEGKDCAPFASSVHLKPLECYLCIPAGLSWELASLLRTTTSLTVLKIGPLQITEQQAHDILAALRENATLKELSIREPFNANVSLLNRSEFTEYLMNSATLTKLHLISKPIACLELEKSWQRILEGISESRTISNVILENLIVGRQGSLIMAKMFKQNTVLRSLNMASLKRYLSLPSINNTCWVVALVQNWTLEEITLEFHMLSLMEWRTLFEAVASKQNIIKMTVTVSPEDHCWLPKLFGLLRECGAEEKTFIDAGSYFIGDRDNSLECKAFSEVEGFRMHCTIGDICRTLQQVPSLHHVKSMRLLIPAVDLDDSLASVLGQCIKTTTSLRELLLDTTWAAEITENIPDCAWSAVVSSLHENKSLRDIFLAAVSIRDEDIECLGDAVRFSTILRSVVFKAQSSDKVDAFYRRLAADITENYSLLHINFRAPSKRNTSSFMDWYAVWEVARRNRDLLELATVFASGIRFDRYCASALEKVAHLPALKEKVAWVASVSEAEASAMIRLASARLQPMDEFMRLAGVVRERVACHPRNDGRVQLHDLNEYCWCSVRRYLSLSDVKGSPELQHEVEHIPDR